MLTRGVATLNKPNDPPILHPAHVQVMDNDVQVDSSFDTAASSSFVNKEVVQANRWPLFTPEKASVYVSVNKEQQILTECCSLDVEIGAKTKSTSAYVLPVSSRPMIFAFRSSNNMRACLHKVAFGLSWVQMILFTLMKNEVLKQYKLILCWPKNCAKRLKTTRKWNFIR